MNWPTEPIKRSYCCGPEGGTTISASAFVQNLPELAHVYIYDPDLYEQDVWKKEWDDLYTCHCELTSAPGTSFNDPYKSEWTGEINTCTPGTQILTSTVRNTTVIPTQVGGWICGEKQNGGCVNSTPCTATVAMSKMESDTLTLRVEVEVKDECGSGCGSCQSTAEVCTTCDTGCHLNVASECVPEVACFSEDTKTCLYREYEYTCTGGSCCEPVTVTTTIFSECRSGRYGSCWCGGPGEADKTLADMDFCSNDPEPVEVCND